jgi:hypothetical protein
MKFRSLGFVIATAAGSICVAALISAKAHDMSGINSQYSHLSARLADQLRDRNTKRNAAQVHGFEAAASGEANKRAAILDQFGLSGSGPSSFEQIYIKNTLWPAAHRFRICFFDGNSAAHKHVFDLFEAISKETNLTLDRTDRNCPDDKADIQIKFNEDSCFSYYGKDALDVIKEDITLPTMALCHLTGPTWSARDDGTIRHEIMHALGAAHEHQHPDSKCKEEFNLDAFRYPPLFDRDLAKNEQAIIVNIAEITTSYTRDELKIIPYDPKSVMHYKLSARFFKDPATATCLLLAENNDLSSADWRFLKTMYPK